ncbi:MAG: hypothetical protein ACK40G_01145 [Cytophagaceae bacterium]
MKGKSVTYFLIAGVVVIWGIIFYRIYISVSSSDNNIIYKAPVVMSGAEINVKDTFDLVANYRDPFLGNLAKVAEDKPVILKAAVPVVKNVPKIKEPEPEMDWSFISYFGNIKNPQTQKTVALISIHGKDYMVSVGQEIQGVVILNNMNDSIRISFEKKSKVIKKSGLN